MHFFFGAVCYGHYKLPPVDKSPLDMVIPQQLPVLKIHDKEQSRWWPGYL